MEEFVMKNVFSCQVALFALFSVLLLTTTAEAANRAGSFSFSAMTGAQIFQDNEAMANTDFVGVNLGYNFTKHVGAELVGTVAVVDYQSDFVPAGTGDFNYWTGRLDLLYHFQPDEQFVPYFAAGVGGAFLSQSQNVQGNPVNEDLIVNYGVGFKYFTTDWLALRLDARQVWRHELGYKPMDHGKNYRNYMLSGGLTFQMGGEESFSDRNVDADNDGVIDALDRCSGTPFGVAVDANGCALDTDQDGVINAVDQCPGTAMGAQVDAQGCVAPVVVESIMIEDADLDGVADIDDKCPNTPSEVPVNERGCPADTDQDGVFDVEDNCPGTAAGKAVDANGCEIDYTALEELNLEISFASNSSKIASKFDTQMQQAADFVKAHPGKKLIVEGHTDNTGSASVNQRLSQKRADTVRWILVRDYGVNRANLKAVGLGEKNPIADNKNQAGRMANRRVIVRLVD
jgi:OOP family OmpA-OmpF porin